MIKSQEQALNMGRATINDVEFAEQLREVLATNKKWMEEKPRTAFIPEIMVFVRHQFKGEWERILIVMPDIDLNKDALIPKWDMMKLIGAKFCQEAIINKPKGKKQNPIAIFMTTEAWSRMEAKDENKKREDDGKWISEMDDKVECLVTAGMTIDGRMNMGFMNVERDKKENMFLTNPTYLDYDEKGRRGSVNQLLANFYIGVQNMLKMEGKY